MPKRKKKKKSSNHRNEFSIDRVFPEHGVHMVTTNVSATANTETITEYKINVSQLGDRLFSISDAYTHWRLCGLKVRQVLQSGTNAGATQAQLGDSYIHSVAFTPTPENLFSTLTTLEQLGDFPHFSYNTGLHPVSLYVGRKGTIGSNPGKWLTVSTASADQSLEDAGTIFFHSISGNPGDTQLAARLRTFISFNVEFKGPIDTTVNPREKITRLQREIKLLQSYVDFSDEKKVPNLLIISK